MSPLSRFQRLSDERQNAILDAAVRDFVDNGYEGASLNRIIAAAGISKGAMYYYFEDKADLFVTAVRRFDPGGQVERAGLLDVDSAASYWVALDALFQAAVQHAVAHPEAVGLGKAFYGIPREQWFAGHIGEYMAEKMAELAQIFEVGQRVGAIRTDLPIPVLQQLWLNINEVLERWALEQWDESTDDQRAHLFDCAVDVFKRTFTPKEQS